jgi:2-oxoglutarate ferredoxin oxidoreductase subunit beta
MVTMKDYEGGVTAWCPGCGNFSILLALKRALVEQNIEPYQVLVVSGIGQAGKLPHYMRCNTLNALHGRDVPEAIGAKIANHELEVIAVGGDGDGYGEGGNHLMHAILKNVDITYVVHDNQIYGLTKGQASPTSDKGFVTKTTPEGVISLPINPIALAISLGATFVSRGFAGEVDHLVELMKKAMQHKGFALIDVLQPCVTFNKLNTWEWYRKRVYKLEDTDYNPTNRLAAFQKALEWGDKIPIGVIYRSDRPTFEEQLSALKERSLVKQKIDPLACEKLLDEFT